MDRRSFTLSLAALAAAPAIPMALPAAPTSAAASRFAAAKLIARAHNNCCPAMLQRLLRVDAGVAAELNTLLLNRGVITAAGSNGVSMAVNPMNTNCVPVEALKPTNLSNAVAKVREDVQARLEKRKEMSQKIEKIVEDQGESDQADGQADVDEDGIES